MPIGDPVLNIQVIPDALRSINSATFTGAYQALGTPLTRPIRLAKFVNNSTVAVTVSWDGVNDHDIYPTLSGTVFDWTTNEVQENGWFIPSGTQIYVKSTAGTGSFYLAAFGG